MKKTDTSFVHTYIEWNNTFELQFKTSKESKSQWLQFRFYIGVVNEWIPILNSI